MTPAPLWICSACGRSFANRNQTHTCASPGVLDDHFRTCDPAVRDLFDAFANAVCRLGPVEIIPEKTRIAFHVRMSFAVLSTRRSYLVGHFVLARRIEHPRFTRVDTFSPRNHVHGFRIDSLADLDEQFLAWMAEAYAVGEQKHI
jgi:hypothetical protein